MTAQQQKALKAIHLLASGLWVSSVIMLMLLPLFSKAIISDDSIYLYNQIYYFIDLFLLTPAAIITLITGFVYSSFTKWGFWKHGWLVYKWIASLFIIISGTVYLGPLAGKLLVISKTCGMAALSNPDYLWGQTICLSAAIINTLLLVVAVVLSVFKPWKHNSPRKNNTNKRPDKTRQTTAKQKPYI